MSELMNARKADLRWHLLITVSALALLTAGARDAIASDGDQPTIWIELGGQLERQTGQGDAFIPAFALNNPSAPALHGFSFQPEKGANFSNGFEGKLTFEPSQSDWVFSASIRYGRANASPNITHATPGHHLHNNVRYITYAPTPAGYSSSSHIHCCVAFDHTPATRGYTNLLVKSDQSHAIIDFQAGREVGLGLFGSHSSSVVSAGVRFAQFTSRSNVTLHERPDVEFRKNILDFGTYVVTYYPKLPTHRYAVTENNARNFHGVGPAISWNASAPLFGNSQKGEVGLDWGANAAVLFGRQHTAGGHRTTAFYHHGYYYSSTHHSGNFGRRRTVTIPNLGGFASVSFRYANAKVSFGYRGDFFFGAMDVGNDTRKTQTVGFYGPFASVSVGLGG